MQYFIEITAKSGKTTTIDCAGNDKLSNAFRSISIKSDTPAKNVKDRATNILVKMKLEMMIDANTKDICRDLMEWSLSSKGEDVHRTVTLKVSNNQNIIRTYKIPNMFVEDYKELYSMETDDESTDNGIFFLKLIQLAGETGNIEQLSE